MKYPKNVLLIEDDEDDRDLFRAALKECCGAVDVKYESSGKSATNLLMDDRFVSPEIIFMDWVIPDYSGKDFLNLLRKTERFSNVPVVIISDAIPEVVMKEVKDLTGIIFLSKPSVMADFVNKLKYIFTLDFEHFKNINI
ncbi:response regulator [Longitalea arenae]|uniref:response regulator n=1 Tax=Longitalea arenae TaxID=2812558 RepID=UPI00196856A4|nr:response regulator [Longitalea arenae]